MHKFNKTETQFRTLICCLISSLSVAATILPARSQTSQSDADSSNGRYKLLTCPFGQFAETYTLDKQTGRVWMMRGEASQLPFLIPCVYQLSSSKTALSPLGTEGSIVSTNNRFSIKSAADGQYADTFVLDKQTGHVWIMRGQMSQVPSLVPCAYQLMNGRVAESPVEEASNSVPNYERFSITCVTSGQNAETFVNDTTCGSVWVVRGQISTTPFLIPCAYQLLDGGTATMPMDQQREISLLRKSLNPAEESHDSQSVFNGSSQTALPKLPADKEKELSDSSNKMEEDLKKLFPQ